MTLATLACPRLRVAVSIATLILMLLTTAQSHSDGKPWSSQNKAGR